MLAVERLERSDEPLVGREWIAGEVNEACSLDCAGVSHILGVSLGLSCSGLPFESRSVCIVKPALAGV